LMAITGHYTTVSKRPKVARTVVRTNVILR
jgi:hypothetical protein